MLWVIPLFGGELGTGGGGVEAKFDAFVGGEIAEHTGAGVGDENNAGLLIMVESFVLFTQVFIG